jgi:hypothetical protein
MRGQLFLVVTVAGFYAGVAAKAEEAGCASTDDSVVGYATATCAAAGGGRMCLCPPIPCTVEADVLWLQRSAGNGALLGRTFNVPNGATIDTLASGDATYGMQAGTRFRLLVPCDDCATVEGIYFGMQMWNGGSSVTPNVAARSLADSPWTQTDKILGGFDQSLAFHSTSRLNNAEINFRQVLGTNNGETIRWLAGLRYVQWDESLALDGINALPTAFEEIEVSCHNQMFGPQLGAEVRRAWDRWTLSVEGKAALLVNVFQQYRSNGNSSGVLPGALPAILPLYEANHSSGVAGVVDLSIVATYALTQHVFARGGYQLLYLAGLAEAPMQFGSYDSRGDLFLHGPLLGLELDW